MSGAGSLPWWIAVALLTLAALAVARPALPSALFFPAGALFATSHVPPYGSIGMACLLAAVIGETLLERKKEPVASAAANWGARM